MAERVAADQGRLQVDGRAGVEAASRIAGQRKSCPPWLPRGIKKSPVWPFNVGGGGGPEGSQEVTDQPWMPTPGVRMEVGPILGLKDVPSPPSPWVQKWGQLGMQ